MKVLHQSRTLIGIVLAFIAAALVVIVGYASIHALNQDLARESNIILIVVCSFLFGALSIGVLGAAIVACICCGIVCTTILLQVHLSIRQAIRFSTRFVSRRLKKKKRKPLN